MSEQLGANAQCLSTSAERLSSETYSGSRKLVMSLPLNGATPLYKY